MTNLQGQESGSRSKSASVVYVCGAVIVLMYSTVTFASASEWFNYLSGIIFVGLAGALAYRGIRLFVTAKTTVDVAAPEK